MSSAISIFTAFVLINFVTVNHALTSPHIVFILADDMGFNDLGYHSDGSLIETPVLDALAADGVKLENYYVQPLCTPTRSQLLTGRYQIHTGMQHLVIGPDQPNCLPLNNDTLANKLSDAGYATHLVGKWHLGLYKRECWPTNRGFQSSFGPLLGSGDHYEHSFTQSGSGRGPRCRQDFVGWDLRDGLTDVHTSYQDQYSTHIFTQRAQDIIQAHDPDQPLFLLMTYQAPHSPIEVPESYSDYYKGKIKNKKRRIYAGMVTCLDEGIGNITDTLKEEGLWNDTILIFSSDNGGVGTAKSGNNWPLRGTKKSFFEGGVRAAGFVASPLLSDTTKGTSNNDLIHISDWFPTLVEGVAEQTINSSELGLDGFNVWDTIKSGVSASRVELLHSIDPLMSAPSSVDSKYDTKSAIFNVSIQASIRYGDWKLLTGNQLGSDDWIPPFEAGLATVTETPVTGQAIWLYNITADPYEQTDLSDTEDATVDFLLGRLQHYYDSSVAAYFPDRDCDADPALFGDVWDSWE